MPKDFKAVTQDAADRIEALIADLADPRADVTNRTVQGIAAVQTAVATLRQIQELRAIVMQPPAPDAELEALQTLAAKPTLTKQEEADLTVRAVRRLLARGAL